MATVTVAVTATAATAAASRSTTTTSPTSISSSPIHACGSKCRLLPASVLARPGVVELAPGCAEALEAAGLCAPEPANDFGCEGVEPGLVNRVLTLDDVGGDEDALWGLLCTMPQWDQDFDGVGDACDLCPFHFDPSNACSGDLLGATPTTCGLN